MLGLFGDSKDSRIFERNSYFERENFDERSKRLEIREKDVESLKREIVDLKKKLNNSRSKRSK